MWCLLCVIARATHKLPVLLFLTLTQQHTDMHKHTLILHFSVTIICHSIYCLHYYISVTATSLSYGLFLICLFLLLYQVNKRKWSENDNTISLNENDIVIDVPSCWASTSKYCATLGHKANHSMPNNAKYDV